MFNIFKCMFCSKQGKWIYIERFSYFAKCSYYVWLSYSIAYTQSSKAINFWKCSKNNKIFILIHQFKSIRIIFICNKMTICLINDNQNIFWYFAQQLWKWCFIKRSSSRIIRISQEDYLSLFVNSLRNILQIMCEIFHRRNIHFTTT